MARIIALDANLILLLVVGMAGPHRIAEHKRLRAFVEADYVTLSKLISGFEELVALPNTLSEASNILGWTRGDTVQLWVTFSTFVTRVREVYVASSLCAVRPEFGRLGLSDCAMIEAAKDQIFILTTDGELYRSALAAGYGADNFIHYTEAAKAIY
jgi:hypothetical protein